MGLKITRQTEAIDVKNVTVLVYGQPGAGKTSLAFTADAPLLLDFDRGAYRSQFRKDSVQVDSWADVAGMTADDLAPYQTVVVDTVGRLLDALAVAIIRETPKLGRNGALSLQGYGELKARYAGWLRTLVSYGKDVILVAHDREDKNGDDIIVRPDIQGSSYGEVFKRADGVAYLYRANRSTVLDFSPTDRWVGKNSGGFAPLDVPNFAQQPAFMAGVLAQIKSALNAMSAEGVAMMAQVEDWRCKLEEAGDADRLNGMVQDAGHLTGPAKAQVGALFAARAKALGLKFDAKGKAYVPAQRDAA